jgi:hypothetical protein
VGSCRSRGHRLLSSSRHSMAETAAAYRIVSRAIDVVNELSLDAGVSRDPATVLIGEAGELNSMGFVNFVVALEEEIESATGRTVSIVERLVPNPSLQASWTVDEVTELVADFLAAVSRDSQSTAQNA